MGGGPKKIGFGAAGPFLTCLDFLHGFITFIHWFMTDLSDLLWLISVGRPAGGGIRTCDLVVERSACQTTELPPSHKIPSGTQNTLRYKKKYPKHAPICPNMPQYVPICLNMSFLRDHLFVTTRVHIKDGNFLIGAPFVSDRPRHLFFRPKKSVLGPLDLFLFIWTS